MWYIVCVSVGVMAGAALVAWLGQYVLLTVRQDRDDAFAYVETLRARVTAFEQHVGAETAAAIHAGVEAAKAKV